MPITLKKLLLHDRNWYHYQKFYKEHGGIRQAVMKSITKIMSCKHYARGHAHYVCSNTTCTHTKRVMFSCKDRACSICGRTATDKWIAKQKSILPPCPWQHVTFTMPSVLWSFFQSDRRLLNEIPKLAANGLKKIALKKEVTPGIFMAIHTFGRKLNWNVHLHVSVTRGGLTENNTWKDVFYKSKTLMKMWRYAIIKLLRKKLSDGTLVIPAELQNQDLYALFDKQYKKYWRVHCAKPHKNPKKDIDYLGRYIKRPAIANSRLLHYDGTEVLFKYLNHRTKQQNYSQLHVFDFISRFTQHIPEQGFRMVRYFGFLANRLRGKLLPIVSKLFNYEPKQTSFVWHAIVKFKIGINPLECVLCKSHLVFSFLCFGLSIKQLMLHHDKLAKRKPIRVNLG